MNIKNSDNKNQTLTHLISFMNGCRHVKDIEGVAHTHLSFGDIIQGRFFIPNEKQEEFIKLYLEAIKYHRLSVLEIPTEYNPILIDIDLNNFNIKENGRLYNSRDITLLLNIYNNSLNQLLDIKEPYTFHIFEKPYINKIDDLYRDGFHVVIPEIITTVHTKIKLRSMVITEITKQGLFNDCITTADQIVDKSIINTNGWFLYGSSKPNAEPYKLTQIFNNKFLEKPLRPPPLLYDLY